MEFSLAALLLIILLAGTVELSRALVLYLSINNAAREAVRFGTRVQNLPKDITATTVIDFSLPEQTQSCIPNNTAVAVVTAQCQGHLGIAGQDTIHERIITLLNPANGFLFDPSYGWVSGASRYTIVSQRIQAASVVAGPQVGDVLQVSITAQYNTIFRFIFGNSINVSGSLSGTYLF